LRFTKTAQASNQFLPLAAQAALGTRHFDSLDLVIIPT
jgi:hypothetical protein